MSREGGLFVTLKAENARVSDIARDLERRLKVPVFVSPLTGEQTVSLEFQGLPLEAAVRFLAPRAYADYAIEGGAASPVCKGLYLLALNEEPPAPPPPPGAGSLTVEGDTEAEDSHGGEGVTLRVTLEKNLFSVEARKAPLTSVLYEMAGRAGVPLDLRGESGEVLDLSFAGHTLEQAMSVMPPSVRLYVRTDLHAFESRPFRLVLDGRDRGSSGP